MSEPSSGVPGEIADADVEEPTTDEEPDTLELEIDEEKVEAWDEVKGDYQVEPGGSPCPTAATGWRPTTATPTPARRRARPRRPSPRPTTPTAGRRHRLRSAAGRLAAWPHPYPPPCPHARPGHCDERRTVRPARRHRGAGQGGCGVGRRRGCRRQPGQRQGGRRHRRRHRRDPALRRGPRPPTASCRSSRRSRSARCATSCCSSCPAALLLSQFLPVALTPLLMIGGTYLCYEGVEKIWERISGHGETQADEAHERRARSPTRTRSPAARSAPTSSCRPRSW